MAAELLGVDAVDPELLELELEPELDEPEVDEELLDPAVALELTVERVLELDADSEAVGTPLEGVDDDEEEDEDDPLDDSEEDPPEDAPESPPEEPVEMVESDELEIAPLQVPEPVWVMDW